MNNLFTQENVAENVVDNVAENVIEEGKENENVERKRFGIPTKGGNIPK